MCTQKNISAFAHENNYDLYISKLIYMSYQEKYLKLNKHFNQKGGQHLNIDDGTTNIGYEDYASSNLTSVKIPDSVTNIGSYAFNINQLTSVKIPDLVTSIGDWAFENNHLTSVIIGNKVTNIDNYAFSHNKLTNVTIPDTVTRIGERAFADNKLTMVIIGNKVTSIGYGVFLSNKLTSVEIPESVTSIGNQAFADNKLTSATIGHRVTSIGNQAFGNNKLTSVTIGNNVTSIGYGAFELNLLTRIEILDSVISIGNDAFFKNQLTSVTIGNNVKSIDSFAFSKNQLQSIVIPDSVTSIDFGAFSGNQLIRLTIGNKVKNIGTSAFSNNQLKYVTIPAEFNYYDEKERIFGHEFKNIIFTDNYKNELMIFKQNVETNSDEYSPEQLTTLLAYLDSSPRARPLFSLIKNTKSTRLKCVNFLDFPNDYVINYSHDMRLEERITRNPFFNEISKDKTSYYNFIVDKKGIIIGEVFNSLENGVVHHLLVENPDDEVYIAGEIKIANNNLEYNFYSETYSTPQNIESNTILSDYLEIIVSKIFKLHRVGTRPLDKITLMHTTLLPKNPFDRKELEYFCSKFSNKIVKVPDSHRCINNSYDNLTAPIKEQITRNFASNSNLLCDESIDRLFPTVAPVVNLVVEHNIFDTIENELKQFGLNIKLGTIDELRVQFRRLVYDPLNFATFKEGVVVDTSRSKNIEFNRVRPNGSVERKIFTYKNHLSSGSFNTTDIYIDKTTNNNKEYIFRSSTSSTFEDQFKSFYENLKHIVLYIIIRKRLGNIKFIPQPYHFGIKKEASTGYITLYMIMEKGNATLGDYIEKTSLSTNQIKKLVFSIYCDLYELSSLSIKAGDNSTLLKFKHNDFKCNNLVISKNGAPLIIDFGFSQFTITDAGRSINFVSCEAPGIKSTYYNLEPNGYNVIHDMLQLLASFNTINKRGFKPFEILKFINNPGSNILDTDVIISIISTFYGNSSIDSLQLYKQFYWTFDLRTIKYPGYTIEITPSELASNIGLTLADRIIDTFEKKYRKYKMKYLNLVEYSNSIKKL